MLLLRFMNSLVRSSNAAQVATWLGLVIAFSGCTATSARNSPPPPAAADAAQIDREVAAILAGPHGTLPRAQAVRADPRARHTAVAVRNLTAYRLTVLFSGVSSRRVIVAPQGSANVALATGSYNVAARVDAAHVLPFAGTQSFSGGSYATSFYLASSPR